jgi:hypothetical protein
MTSVNAARLGDEVDQLDLLFVRVPTTVVAASISAPLKRRRVLLFDRLSRQREVLRIHRTWVVRDIRPTGLWGGPPKFQ